MWRSAHDEDVPPPRRNGTERRPVERSQPVGRMSERGRIRGLYPSLPDTDEYDAGVREGGRRGEEEEKEHPDAHTQSEVPAGGGDVGAEAQLILLERQRQELLSINEKWAREYRTMVKYYREKVQDLQASQHVHNREEEEEEKEEEGKRVMAVHKRARGKEVRDKVNARGNVISDLLKAAKEAEELRAQNCTLARRGQHQQEEIRRLNKALEETLQPAAPAEAGGGTLLDTWKHQADVYKEDFLKERRDREKLNERYVELERRFRKAREELHALKSQATWTRRLQPALDCCCQHSKAGGGQDGRKGRP